MRTPNSSLWALVVLALGSAAGGCAARVSQFHEFAAAGVSFVKASEAVLDEAGTAATRADTMVLVDARALLKPEERRARVQASNQALKTRMAILRDIRRHGRVLQRYFEFLASIADSKAPQSAATAAEATFVSLGDLSTAIKTSPLQPVVPSVTKLIVGAFKVRILEDELRRRADAVATELALQEGAFQAIGRLLATDVTVQLNKVETTQVIGPFVQDETLPKEWPSTRESFLKSIAIAASTDAAANASKALREAFQAVVANRFDSAALRSLLDDIGEMLAVSQKLTATLPDE